MGFLYNAFHMRYLYTLLVLLTFSLEGSGVKGSCLNKMMQLRKIADVHVSSIEELKFLLNAAKRNVEWFEKYIPKKTGVS